LSRTQSSDAHLETEEIVGYLAKTLAPAEREGVERHLADCAECTSEMVAVGRLRPRDHSSNRRLATIAAAAAALAGIALLGPGLVHYTPTDGRVRGSEAQATVTVLAPASGAIVHRVPDFAWRPVSGATAYHLSLSRSNGDSVWATTTRDTSIRAPKALSKAGPGLYYWYVDVLLGDARSIAGSAHEFRIAP
jgi:hypothetical protein